MSHQPCLPLSVIERPGTTGVNGRWSVRAEGEYRVVLVAGLPVHHYNCEDVVAEAYAMVLLVEGGYATQKQVAAAFDCAERTVRRHQERYANGGMAALGTRCGWRPGRRRIAGRRLRVIERLKDKDIDVEFPQTGVWIADVTVRSPSVPNSINQKWELTVVPRTRTGTPEAKGSE